jgi:hypothetical protein
VLRSFGIKIDLFLDIPFKKFENSLQGYSAKIKFCSFEKKKFVSSIRSSLQSQSYTENVYKRTYIKSPVEFKYIYFCRSVAYCGIK